MNSGKIKWYDNKKGFGIVIDSNSNNEIFVHHSNFDKTKNKFVTLEENELIHYNLDTISNRETAINIRCDEKKNTNNYIKFNKKIRNTTNFNPSHSPTDMRIMVHNSKDKYDRTVTARDVIFVKNLFHKEDDIFNKLKNEIENANINQDDLWKSWHGESHFIADDHLDWKNKCPTFNQVLLKISEYFDMKIKATRLNYYRDSKEWKPFHHDAAAVKNDKAKTQNFTVAISFGLEREVAFEHAKSGVVISMPVDDGSVYVFSKDVNIIWKHGIRQMKDEDYVEEGRFSIIAWGWKEMID